MRARLNVVAETECIQSYIVLSLGIHRYEQQLGEIKLLGGLVSTVRSSLYF
jgi:hypothetical protein